MLATLSQSDEIQLAIAIMVGLPLVCVAIAFVFRAAWKVGLILHEVTPNSGESLKDRVMKLERSQTDQTNRLNRIESKIDAQTAHHTTHKTFNEEQNNEI